MSAAQQHSDLPNVTVITVNGNVVRATAALSSHPYHLGVFRWFTSWAYSELAELRDEHITWIRGWHEEDSPEVRALKAARAL